jgi:hypothetical protein
VGYGKRGAIGTAPCPHSGQASDLGGSGPVCTDLSPVPKSRKHGWVNVHTLSGVAGADLKSEEEEEDHYKNMEEGRRRRFIDKTWGSKRHSKGGGGGGLL